MYTNHYRPPTPIAEAEYHLNTPLESYDINFQYPVKVLQRSYIDATATQDSIRLEPLIPSIHAEALFDALKDPIHDDIFRYLYYGPFKTLASLLTFLEAFRADNTRTMFIIYDLSSGEKRIAGFIGYLDGVATDLRVEIGAVTILKAYQRTHVTTHAVALLAQYGLNNLAEGGLALRRVWWKCNASNQASMNCALRLGFRLEGIARFGRSVNRPKEGVELPETEGAYGQPNLCRARHDAVLAVCVDEYIGIAIERPGFNGREHLAELLDRPVLAIGQDISR